MSKTSKKRGASPRVSEPRTLPRPAATWQVQTAKARFSELFRRARNGVPLLPAGPNAAPVTLDLVNRLRDEL